MLKEKVCRFGHICTSGCQKDFDCPCLSEHCCAMSEEVCDRTCDDCYFKEKELVLEAQRLASEGGADYPPVNDKEQYE